MFQAVLCCSLWNQLRETELSVTQFLPVFQVSFVPVHLCAAATVIFLKQAESRNLLALEAAHNL